MIDIGKTTLLDTDVLSAVMRRQPTVIAFAQEYLKLHGHFTFSLITRYEILRGLHAKRATTQLTTFENLCNFSDIIPLTDGIVVCAAKIHADLRSRGLMIGDADILIAATALENDWTVTTNNVRHFSRIVGIQINNWLDDTD